jgi:hypothetical protein
MRRWAVTWAKSQLSSCDRDAVPSFGTTGPQARLTKTCNRMSCRILAHRRL